MYRVLAIFVVAWLLAPALASAQLLDSLVAPNQLVANPTHPEPGESVTVTLDDYAGGVYGSQITWTYNGDTIPDSTNRRSVTVTAGALGAAGTIRATLTAPDGRTEVLRTTINPVYLDIIIEPQTHVPAWYQGRGMPSLGSQVNVTALVHDGTTRKPADLVYTWQVNQRVLEAGPVRGRNKMSFSTPRGNNFLLSLSVSTPGGEIIASRLLRVETATPDLLFYERHALYGTTRTPLLASTPLVGNTLTLTAEPYNLDTRVFNNPDVAVWQIDSIDTNNGTSNPYEITLQQSAAGRATVAFHVRSLQEVLQGAKKTVGITF